MKKFGTAFLITIPLFLAFFGAIYHFTNSQSDPDHSRFKKLDSFETEGVPTFSGKLIDGGEFNLEKFKGKILIINFWASWCAPCVEEMPSLLKLAKQFSKDVELIAVSSDSDLHDISVFLKGYPDTQSENVHILFDPKSEIIKNYGVDRLPESFVIGRDFKLKKKIIGSIDWFSKDAIEYMNTLIH